MGVGGGGGDGRGGGGRDHAIHGYDVGTVVLVTV